MEEKNPAGFVTKLSISLLLHIQPKLHSASHCAPSIFPNVPCPTVSSPFRMKFERQARRTVVLGAVEQPADIRK